MVPSRVNAAISLWRTQLPAVKPFYAVKCNPDPTFLNMLFDANINFDCASERELRAIRDLARNTLPNRVVYANPCKSERDLVAAKEMGSPMTVVDSVEEVEKLSASQYSGGALVRVAVDDTDSLMPFSSKFGAPESQVEKIIVAAAGRRLPLHGISFHVGSGSGSADAVSRAMMQVSKFYSMFPIYGHREAKILDIGGGFLPCEEDFRKKCIHIRGALEDLAPLGLKVIAEPGRFFAANSFDFYVKVIGKKAAFSICGTQVGWRYTVDDSIYGQFSNILFDKARPQWVRVSPDGKTRRYVKGTIFGRTCDSLDWIAKSEQMEELEVGDWLWFPRMGAYTRATATEFNGFPMPDVIVTDSICPSTVEKFPWQMPLRVEFPRSVGEN